MAESMNSHILETPDTFPLKTKQVSV